MLPHTPSNYRRIGDPFIKLARVDSTNNYAMGLVESGHAEHGTAILAAEQTQGRGQRGKRWFSIPGQSLTMSILLFQQEQGAQPGFEISALTALACYDLLKSEGLQDLSIKWPNDLYWRDRKAGGILIENRIRASLPAISVVGIGLNINQEEFPELEFAVSLKTITGQEKDVEKLALKLCSLLDGYYQRSLVEDRFFWLPLYNDRLYMRGQNVKLQTRSGPLETTIIGINQSGSLITTQGIFYQGNIIWLRD